MKHLLIIKASKDVCKVEVDHIRAIAGLFEMDVVEHTIDSTESLFELAALGKRFDYVYLAAHANTEGFGDPDGYFVPWYDFSMTICPFDIINHNGVFLLACCRGGIKDVSYDIFAGCAAIEYVCGPRWKVSPPDLTLGFHTFIYNVEDRRMQPDQAAKRASAATGFDFLWYDRVEIEKSAEYQRHVAEFGEADCT